MKLTNFSLSMVTALTAACSTPASRPPAEPTPVAVLTARATTNELASAFEAGGVVRARLTAAIASRVMAPIAQIAVRPGDRVRRDATLVILDARDLTANRARAAAALTSAAHAARAAESDVAAADAAVTLARATYDRMRQLLEKRSATPQELDQAKAAVDGADAQVQSARARAASAAAARDAAQAALDAATVASSYATLTAPFNGIVTERLADPGAMAAPGAPLLTLEDPAAFRLEVPLDEARANAVVVGQMADVRVGDDNSPTAAWAAARVSEVARVDPAAHSFLIKIDLAPAGALRSGRFGRARFSGPSRVALTIPEAALVSRGQLTFVFAVDARHRAHLQPVSVGAAANDRVEILAGIHEGDTVVVAPPAALADGAPVTGDRR